MKMRRHPSLRGWGGSTFAALAVATFSAIAVAPPWDGDKIVFGETEQGRAFSLDSAASASGVYFRHPATLGGAGPLTLVAPALIYGGGVGRRGRPFRDGTRPVPEEGAHQVPAGGRA